MIRSYGPGTNPEVVSLSAPVLVGAAFLILPGRTGGNRRATGRGLHGGVGSAPAGAAFGALTGAIVGLGVSKDKAIRYESQVKAGKFLVTLRGDGRHIERAKFLFTGSKAETTEAALKEARAMARQMTQGRDDGTNPSWSRNPVPSRLTTQIRARKYTYTRFTQAYTNQRGG